MFLQLIIFVLLINYLKVFHLSEENIYGKVQSNFTYCVLSEDLERRILTKSAVECSVLCKNFYPQCSQFFMNTETSQCHLCMEFNKTNLFHLTFKWKHFVNKRKHCKITENGFEYLGNLNITEQGYDCQKWSEQSPQKHNQQYRNYPDGSIDKAENFCRNPDNSTGGPWCYTLTESIRFGFCSVYFC